MGAPRVAIVDPQTERGESLAAALAAQGWQLRLEPSADALATGDAPDLVLLSCDEPRAVREGMSTLRRVLSTPAPVIVIGGADDLNAADVFAEGAADCVSRSVPVAELSTRIRARLWAVPGSSAPPRSLPPRGGRMLLELTQALSSETELRDILFTVVRRVAQVIDVDRVSIVLAGVGDEAFVIAASDDQTLRDLPIKLDVYPEIRRVLESGEPFFIENAANHALFDLAQVALPSRFRALTLFPICFQDKVMGVLFLRFAQPRALSEEDEYVLGAVANATGIALRNATLVSALRDQSRQARVEAARELEALTSYVDFFNSSPDGILVVTLDGEISFCNPAATEITERTKAELLGARFEHILSPDAKKRFDKLQSGFAEGVFPSNVDLPIKTPGEGRRVLNVGFSSVLRDDRRLVVSLRDVTDERALARELTKTKEFLQRVIDSSVDAIVSSDTRGNVLLFNPAAERTYGYTAEEVVGKMNVRDLYPPKTARRIMQLIRSRHHGGKGVLHGYQTELLGKDGAHIPVMLSASLIIHRGRSIGSVGVFRDLRATLHFEQRLQQAQQELEVQEKKAFIVELAGATAHELNQPLTTVMGYAGMLERQLAELDGIDPRLKRASAAIVRETERMAEIVRKIGKLTRYESKSYVGDTKIIDIERSIDTEPPVL